MGSVVFRISSVGRFFFLQRNVKTLFPCMTIYHQHCLTRAVWCSDVILIAESCGNTTTLQPRAESAGLKKSANSLEDRDTKTRSLKFKRVPFKVLLQ